jgi:uncharacterized membrane protein YccC
VTQPGADLSRLPIAFDLRAISIEEGVRAGLSIAVLVAADYVLHAPILLEAGLGALLTCLCDAGGLVRRRVPALLSFAAVGGLMIAALGLLRPIGYPLVPLAALGIFAFSFVRVYGPSAQQVGNLLNVVLVLALDRSFHTLRPALLLAAAFVGGSLWALLLTMVIWRLHPNLPARRAVARVYVALAAFCDDLHALLDRDHAPAEPEWERHARGHRRAVRDAIELARSTVAERLRVSGTGGRPAAQSLLRLESAEQMFWALIALTDLLETGLDASARPAAAALTEQLAAVLRAFGPHIIEDSDIGLAAIGAAIARIAATARSLTEPAPLRRIADLLVERLRATLNLTGTTDALPGAPPPAETMDRLLAPLRANLNWQSAALRHAARTALVAAAGFAITFTWPTSYQHWLTITLVLTLQPYYALTLQRALERIGGTVLGGLLAAVLSLVCRTPLTIAAAIFPLSVLALSLRSVNFGLYMSALTPLVVLLVELAAPTHGHFAIAAMRAVYTVIGGTLAVLGCVFLWPSWEPGRLDGELRAAVRSHGRYAELELGLLQGEATQAAVDAARRAAGMASNNLEASLNRALVEPGHAAKQIDTTLRGSDVLAHWRHWIADVTALLDQTLPPPLPPPPEQLPKDATLAEALSRIARQLELSAGALRRYGEG